MILLNTLHSPPKVLNYPNTKGKGEVAILFSVFWTIIVVNVDLEIYENFALITMGTEITIVLVETIVFIFDRNVLQNPKSVLKLKFTQTL